MSPGSGLIVFICATICRAIRSIDRRRSASSFGGMARNRRCNCGMPSTMTRLTLALCAGLACVGPATATTDAARPDRAETCGAIGVTADSAVTLFSILIEAARACTAEGADTAPCLLLLDFVTEFDARPTTEALATIDAGIIDLCAGARD